MPESWSRSRVRVDQHVVDVPKVRLGWDGLTSKEHTRLAARLNLIGALDSHTFIFGDLAELGLEEFKERYPRLAKMPWVMECLERNVESWETIPECEGRLVRYPLDGEYLPPGTLEANFAFDLRAKERTMTEAIGELKAEFSEWYAATKKELLEELKGIYSAGSSFPPRVSEDHFVWTALRLAGKRGDDRGYGLTIAEISGGGSSDGLNPRGVERAIQKVLSLTG